MSKHKYTNVVCIAVICLSLLATTLFLNGDSLGISDYSGSVSYADTIFDDSYVHTINIDIDEDDWANMLENAADEEYFLCDIEIDNDVINDVAIRTKGNSSLRDIVKSDSDRYSFKVEFDHYDDSLLYYGLDKLTLSNIYQDPTYLKDYLSYQMLNSMDVSAPLASYVYVTVNDEDFGLYLAVEAVEDSFLDRVYGDDSDGSLYKPETTSDIGDQQTAGIAGDTNEEALTSDTTDIAAVPEDGMRGQARPELEDGEIPEDLPEGAEIPEDGVMPDDSRLPPDLPEGAELTEDSEGATGLTAKTQGAGAMTSNSNGATLEYTDDEYTSYTDIFDNAKTDITDSDKDTLIAALKQLNSGEDIDTAIDVDSVIDYFVVHNYLLNYDSYTGSMLHNYYLYEDDGLLSMIGWDYNLSFGTFICQQNETATAYVNYAIDTPTANTTLEERPMLNMILSDDEYLEQYHDEFSEFLDSYFESGYFEETVDSVSEMIAPYVEKDPTAFYTYDEFLVGVDSLKDFCLLRTESIQGQLDGTIPSTASEQADSSALIDADDIIMSALGSK